jgi:trimethylamine--corrinoid protein Co-methyltransferase
MKSPFKPSVRVQTLSQNSIKKIHNAAMEVLERTGVAINTEEGRRILMKAGCKFKEPNVILIPPKLVGKGLKTAPSSVTLYNRLGEPACVLEGWNTSYGTGSDCPFILDRQTQQRRPCTYDDVAKAAIVVDYLENFDFIMPVGIISDRPTHVADVYAVEATMLNTVKPVVFTAHNKGTFQASVDMAAAVVGGLKRLQEKPFICLYDEPTSPLKHMPEATDKLIHAARLKIPLVFTPCPALGATAPATRAGLLVQAVAECLSGLVLHQLANPGAPIIFGGVMIAMDMRTTIYAYGSPEFHQLCAALTDISHYYKLPMFGTAGCSDAKRVDAQVGLEMGFSILMSTLSGQNLIHDVGYINSGLIVSYESYVLANDAIGMAKHIAGGIPINKETLAVDVIHAVGQTGDHLTNDHTLKFLRKEFFFPSVIDRTNYAAWEKSGSKTMDVTLKEKVDEILGTHIPQPMESVARQSMSQILNDIEKQAASS